MLDTLPTFPDTIPLSLQHQQLIKDYNQRQASIIGALTFTNLFVMDTQNTTHLSQLHDNLLIIQDISLTVHGQNDLATTIQRLRDEPYTLEVWEQGIAGLVPDLDNAEYLYSVEGFVRMQGGTYANVRRKIHACQEHGVMEFKKVDATQYEDVWALTSKQTDIDRQDLDALEKYLTFADALSAETWGLFIENKLCGFVVTEMLPAKTILIHFFKTDRGITGLAEYFFYAVAKQWGGQATTINFEQDLGIPGLRQFKQSLRPAKLLTPYNLL